MREREEISSNQRPKRASAHWFSVDYKLRLNKNIQECKDREKTDAGHRENMIMIIAEKILSLDRTLCDKNYRRNTKLIEILLFFVAKKILFVKCEVKNIELYVTLFMNCLTYFFSLTNVNKQKSFSLSLFSFPPNFFCPSFFTNISNS